MRRFVILVFLLVSSDVFAGMGRSGPGWNVQRFGQRNPLEMNGGMLPLSQQPDIIRFFTDVFSISEQGERTRLDYYGKASDQATPTEIPITGSSGTEFNFGLSAKISYSGGIGTAAWIKNGQVWAVDVQDGQPRTPVVVNANPNYGETQIAHSMRHGTLISAYNFRSQNVEIFRRNEMGGWGSLGVVPTPFVCGGILNGPRVTFDVDKKEDVFTLGWSNSGTVLNYNVQRFTLPGLQPASPRVALPITFRNTKVTEVQMEVSGLLGAFLTIDVNNHYKLVVFSFSGTPLWIERDLGLAPEGMVGGVAVTMGPHDNVFAAIMRRNGSITLIEFYLAWLLFSSGVGYDATEFPPIENAFDGAGGEFPLSIDRGGRGLPFQVRYRGSLGIATFTGCTNGRNTLCNSDRRFEITADWRDAQGNTGSGRAVPLTADTGYFWFFGSSNVELVVKVLNGCGFNQRFWVFAGGLTDVEVTLTVRDTLTGDTKTYHNPRGTAFRPIQDTSAFSGCAAGGLSAPQTASLAVREIGAGDHHGLDLQPAMTSAMVSALLPLPNACSGTDTSLCVSGGRFRIEANWRTPDGRRGVGRAVRLTDDSGYFWFFDAKNIELIAKVLNACSFSSTHWVFAAGLTDVEVELVVTDTNSGAVKRYTNAAGTAFQPIQDTSAFSTCP